LEKHRLSAIMFTDIVSYTRKMGEDEKRMMGLLQIHSQLVESAVVRFEGQIIQRIGVLFLSSLKAL